MKRRAKKPFAARSSAGIQYTVQWYNIYIYINICTTYMLDICNVIYIDTMYRPISLVWMLVSTSIMVPFMNIGNGTFLINVSIQLHEWPLCACLQSHFHYHSASFTLLHYIFTHILATFIPATSYCLCIYIHAPSQTHRTS